MIKAYKKLFAFAGEYSKDWNKAILFDVICSMFEALQFVPLLIVLKALVEDAVTPATAWLSLGLVLVSIAGQGIVRYLSHSSSMQASYLMCDEKRINIGERLKYMPMGHFNRENIRTITAACTTTMEDLESMAGAVIVRVFVGMLQSMIMIFALMFFDWRIGLVYLIGIVVYLIVNSLKLAMGRKNGPGRLQAQIKLSDATLEFVQGMGVARAFNLDKQANTTFENAIEESEAQNFKIERKSTPYTVVQQSVLKLFAVLALTVSICLTFAGTMDVSVCLLMIVAAFFVYKQAEAAGVLSLMLSIMDVYIDRVNEINSIPLIKGKNNARQPDTCSLVFENVFFSYGGRQIIKKINLHIPEKTSCAIVGPSGSGKTTLANLMTRFWDVDQGCVRLGGVDIRDLEADDLMAYFSMVFQDVYLFNDSIENNIKFAKPDATHEEVVEAAQAARCDHFIRELPYGYKTMLGEGGATVSGGEKQRISIARAILKDAPIVILDEATANVDPENEADLQQAIEALMNDKTVIMIAHRLKTVQKVDQIIVLDAGEIVSCGTHEELIARPGIYADFVAMRTKAIDWKLGTQSM